MGKTELSGIYFRLYFSDFIFFQHFKRRHNVTTAIHYYHNLLLDFWSNFFKMEKNNLDSNNSTGFDKDTKKDSLGFTRQYYSNSTKIGVIADIQYADVEDETNAWSGETRRFRESLKCAKRAGKHFQNVGVDLVLQMGDILDGKSGKDYKRYLFERILPALKCTKTKNNSEEEIEVPRIDIMGNHELYLAKRNEWKNLSNFFDVSSNELRSYREICNDKWRVIFLDTYAVNVVEFTPDEIQGALEYPFRYRDQWPEKYRIGHEFLEENNLQALKGYSGEQKIDWFKGVPTEKKKFVPFNGGLGEKQLKWLENQLSEAYQKKQLVCLFGHIPITKNNWSSKCILWDSEDLGKLLKESGQHTAAYFGKNLEALKL